MTRGPRTVAVGREVLDDRVLEALARSRVVRGPAHLVTAVRHLLPPVTRVEVGEPLPAAGEGPEVVLLVDAQPAGARDVLARLVAGAQPADPMAMASAQRRLDGRAKPPGSLGRLEDFAVRLAGLAGRSPAPVPSQPAVLVAAGDHGVVAQGVSRWPQQVTAAMVDVCVEGGAAISVLARTVGAQVHVLDVGVAGALRSRGGGGGGAASTAGARLWDRRVRDGTADLSQGDAMRGDDATAAVRAGADLVGSLAEEGVDLLVLGDLGIGNTTAAACLLAVATGAEAASVTGRGAGADDDGLARKRRVVATAVTRLGDRRDPLDVLAAVGGLEHAALAGAILAASARRLPVVLDGLSAVAAAVVAVGLAPAARDALVAGHCSAEPGVAVGLEHLQLVPVLDLSLRLGEGTGGVLAVPVLRGAAAVLAEMAALDDVIP